MDCNGLDLHFLKLDCVCSFHYKRALLAEVSPAMPIYVWKSCDVEWSFPLKRNRMIIHYSFMSQFVLLRNPISSANSLHRHWPCTFQPNPSCQAPSSLSQYNRINYPYFSLSRDPPLHLPKCSQSRYRQPKVTHPNRHPRNSHLLFQPPSL